VDEATQSDQIEKAIRENVDAIVLHPASFTDTKQSIRRAKDAGIPLVLLHEQTDTISDAAAFVGPDFTGGGGLVMDRLTKDFPDGSNIAVLLGPENRSATSERRAGYLAELDGVELQYPIHKEGFCDPSREAASDLVSGWLADDGEIEAILCGNDEMAIGAMEAAHAANRKDIKIYGMDAQDSILELIKQDKIAATGYVNYDTEANTAVFLVNSLLQEKKIEKINRIPIVTVYSENVDAKDQDFYHACPY
jgi:ABC-type sugar transport system substrate-binding protein